MIQCKRANLRAGTVCPICGSSRTEPINKTRDGNTRFSCRSCGCVFEVPTEEE